MSEGLQQWDFVLAAYVIGVAGTVLLIGWALTAMRRAERRRDKVKQK